MAVYTTNLGLSTPGHTKMVDITRLVGDGLARSQFRKGLLALYVPGSTGRLMTLEYEPRLVGDLRETLKRLVPGDRACHHNRAWGDRNGHNRLRASLAGPSLSVSFRRGRLILGTWQQIALVDLANRPRSRVLTVQVMGE